MSLELKIPPPAQVLICAAMMWLFATVLPAAAHPLPLAPQAAALSALSGVIITVTGILQFRRAGTTVLPMRPHKAKHLITTGVYRFTRNPMYLGMLLLLTGWGIYLANAAALIPLPLFVISITRLQIIPEERALKENFGEAFTTYQKKVRRWI